MGQPNQQMHPFEPTWESLKGFRVPKWYEDAKFGIFIHWGVYAVPAFGNEWYPRNMYQQGSPEFEHHLTTYGPHSEFGYKDFIPQFTAANYDPAEWAKLFKESGAKFVVPVAEHHDGFPMYDSNFSDWTAVKMGPKRDLIGALAKAVRAEELIFGLSSHRAENWYFYDGGRKFPSDVRDDHYRGLYGPAEPAPPDLGNPNSAVGPDKSFVANWYSRTTELVDKYHPQLFWFDWCIEHDAFKEALQQFAAYYYNQAQGWGSDWDENGAAINYKHKAFPEGAAVFDVERGQMAGIRPYFWQNDTSVSKNSWCYVKNQDYKTPTSIIGDLVDIVSKNGALLLNIGPRPDGTIPEAEQEILRAIGSWLAVNGEAIYNTRPWQKYGEGPTEVSEGTFTDTKRENFTSQDIRFTSGDKALYATCLAWPETEVIIKSLGSDSEVQADMITDIQLLGHAGKLEWSQAADGLHIQPPAQAPNEHAYAFKIRMK